MPISVHSCDHDLLSITFNTGNVIFYTEEIAI